MSAQHTNTYPKLHNAMWPGLVGKGSPGAEPSIDLDTMLDLTARAEVDGIRFEGVDLFLFEPHVNIEIDQDGVKRLAEKIGTRGFVVGSVVAPVWQPTGGGSALGSDVDQKNFVGQVRKACQIAKTLRDLGVRPNGVVRIDSACSVTDWTQDPDGNQQRIAQTFAEACDVAEGYGERLAAEGEICWGGMHSWRKMLDLLERVNRPRTLGLQADMAHTLLYILGYNEPQDALLPAECDWSDPGSLDAALETLTDALRPWTIDFHVAQNDATVKGSGTHDKTGHHCLPNDPNGKLTIPHHAGFWLRGEDGTPTKAFRHICWDGCMFPNAVMSKPETWNDILAAMIAVRDEHGWTDDETKGQVFKPETVMELEMETVEVPLRAVAKVAAKKRTIPERKPRRVAKPKPARRPAKARNIKRQKPSRKPKKSAKPNRKAMVKVKSKRASKVAKKRPAKARRTTKSKTKRTTARKKVPARSRKR
jgi:Xylose isomerase-like TIM barrel